MGGLFKRKIGEVKAVDGVSFKLRRRKTLGLVEKVVVVRQQLGIQF